MLADWLDHPTTNCALISALEGYGTATLVKRVAQEKKTPRAVVSATTSKLLRTALDTSRKVLDELPAGALIQHGLDALDPLMLAFFAQVLTAVARAWELSVSHLPASLSLVSG